MNKLLITLIIGSFLFTCSCFAFSYNIGQEKDALVVKVFSLETKIEVLSTKIDTMNTKIDSICEVIIKHPKQNSVINK